MTRERAQQIVTEIREVLARHHAALVGDCSNEGIYAEIDIVDADKAPIGRETELSVTQWATSVEVILPAEVHAQDGSEQNQVARLAARYGLRVVEDKQ